MIRTHIKWFQYFSLFLRLQMMTISPIKIVPSSQNMTWIYCLTIIFNHFLTLLIRPTYQLAVIINWIRVVVQLKEQFLHFNMWNLGIANIFGEPDGSPKIHISHNWIFPRRNNKCWGGWGYVSEGRVDFRVHGGCGHGRGGDNIAYNNSFPRVLLVPKVSVHH